MSEAGVAGESATSVFPEEDAGIAEALAGTKEIPAGFLIGTDISGLLTSSAIFRGDIGAGSSVGIAIGIR
ncbi:MAG: hypothetical protein JWN02_1438, partial [Acidobacteria bacterium]|nr:hypothetical protein [Acidobacteriota bacterium]